MFKIKTLFAIIVTLLFFGVTFNPVTASIDTKEEIELGFIDDGRISKQIIQLSIDKIKEIETELMQLTEEMEATSDYDQLLEIVNSYKVEWGRFSILNLIIGLIQRFLKFTHNIGQSRPLKRDAFVMSWGFGSKLNPFKDNKFKLLVPIKLWFYTGRGNLLLNSRTLIVDPYPFNIKSITGRQVGCMRNFVGLYIYRHNTLTDKTYTFMLGRAGSVRGLDLSPFNVWKQ